MAVVARNASREQACSTCVSCRFFTVPMLLRERERERERGRLWENRLITKTAFPPLDVTCPVHMRACSVSSRCARERREGKN